MKNEDYIKRSDAINALTVSAMLRNLDSVEDGPAHMYKRAAERIIASVPVADVEPKRKTGWWIDVNPATISDPRMRCTVCGHIELPRIHWRFCPSCGAKLEGSNDES